MVILELTWRPDLDKSIWPEKYWVQGFQNRYDELLNPPLARRYDNLGSAVGSQPTSLPGDTHLPPSNTGSVPASLYRALRATAATAPLPHPSYQD